jgi:hypothetical protein
MPWLSLLLMKKQDFKLFLPVGTLISLILAIETDLSNKFNLWKIKGTKWDRFLTDFTFILGPFFIGTLWIFRFTFGRFPLFLLANIIMDYFLAYPLTALFKRLRIYKLKKLKSFHLFSLSVFYSTLLYGYQLYLEKDSP